jgi:hypothetical protein
LPELVVEAGLIVPELEARVGLDQRQHPGGVAVATGEGQRAAGLAAPAVELGAGLAAQRGIVELAAATGGVTPTIERDLDEAASIGETDLEFAVDAVAAGGLRPTLDHAADVAT